MGCQACLHNLAKKPAQKSLSRLPKRVALKMVEEHLEK
jgi:hypothetical protein